MFSCIFVHIQYVPYLNTYIALYFVRQNYLKTITNQRKLVSIPHQRSFPLANYPHSEGGPTNIHPFLVIPSFGVPGVGCLLGRSLLCAFTLPLWFQSYRCLSCLFLSRHSVLLSCSLIIYNVVSLYVFFSEFWGVGGEM